MWAVQQIINRWYTSKGVYCLEFISITHYSNLRNSKRSGYENYYYYSVTWLVNRVGPALLLELTGGEQPFSPFGSIH